MNDKQLVGIVYNACFGGFGLSDQAIARYAQIKGVHPDSLYHRDIPRNDPALVQVLEELKQQARNAPALLQVALELKGRANTVFSSLQIEYLPKGTRYRIAEYDGLEAVETPDSIRWEVA